MTCGYKKSASKKPSQDSRLSYRTTIALSVDVYGTPGTRSNKKLVQVEDDLGGLFRSLGSAVLALENKN